METIYSLRGPVEGWRVTNETGLLRLSSSGFTAPRSRKAAGAISLPSAGAPSLGSPATRSRGTRGKSLADESS